MAGLDTVLETTNAERPATGFVFTEGPLWHPDDFYYFADVRASSSTGCGSASRRKPCAPIPARATARPSTCRAGWCICEGGNRRLTRWSDDTAQRGADRPLRGQADQPPERRRLQVGRQHLVHRSRAARAACRQGAAAFRGLRGQARRHEPPRRRIRIPERARVFARRAHALRRQYAPRPIHPRDRARPAPATWSGGGSSPTCRRRRPTACPTA